MLPSVVQSVAWQCLVVLWALAGVLDAYDLTVKRNPLASSALKVTLDYAMATAFPLDANGNRQLKAQVKRNFMYSTHLTFPAPVSVIADGQLWQMALDAFSEIDPDFAQYGMQNTKKNRPDALTVLAVGNEVILASSQKGPVSFVNSFPGSPVKLDLELCQAIWLQDGPSTATNTGHRTNGKCGEEMAAHLYYMTHGGMRLADQGARIGTVVVVDGVAKPTDPCLQTEEKFGCRQYMQVLGVTVLDASTTPAPYDFATLVPAGPPVIDQIQACGDIVTYS